MSFVEVKENPARRGRPPPHPPLRPAPPIGPHCCNTRSSRCCSSSRKRAKGKVRPRGAGGGDGSGVGGGHCWLGGPDPSMAALVVDPPENVGWRPHPHHPHSRPYQRRHHASQFEQRARARQIGQRERSGLVSELLTLSQLTPPSFLSWESPPQTAHCTRRRSHSCTPSHGAGAA